MFVCVNNAFDECALDLENASTPCLRFTCASDYVAVGWLGVGGGGWMVMCVYLYRRFVFVCALTGRPGGWARSCVGKQSAVRACLCGVLVWMCLFKPNVHGVEANS